MIDGLIVREMLRRCDYDAAQVSRILDLASNPSPVVPHKEQPNYIMTKLLWSHYKACGYLSARIFDYLDKGTINLVDRKVILQLIASLPAKPFKVVTVHD